MIKPTKCTCKECGTVLNILHGASFMCCGVKQRIPRTYADKPERGPDQVIKGELFVNAHKFGGE